MSEETKDQYDIARSQAEAGKLEAEAKHQLALANKEAQHNKLDSMNLELVSRNHDFTLADDSHHRVYRFADPVDEDSVGTCAGFLGRWARMGNEPIEIVLTTPGGNAWYGMALIDQILAIRGEGTPVNVTIRGTAASMGAFILQAGSVRKMGPTSTLMMHKGNAQLGGTMDQIIDYVKWWDLQLDILTDLMADRCKNAGEQATKRLTKAAIKKGIDGKDWSVGPKDALTLGLIDDIG